MSGTQESLLRPEWSSDALSHIGLLYKHADRVAADSYDVWLHPTIRAEFRECARRLGAEMLLDDEDPNTHADFLGKTENHFTMNPSKEYAAAVTASLAATIPRLKRPRTMPFLAAEADNLEDNLPYVLAFPDMARGEGKYLIEHPEQHAKAAKLIKERANNPLLQTTVASAEVRQYIQTPSNRHTSYRLLITATGSVIGAGLLYSDHSKNNGRKVADDLLAFSSPDSPYYLNAQDVRSNVSQGGHIIPLMGDNRVAVADFQREILEAHGIDHNNPAVPEELASLAVDLAKHHSRHLNLYTGADFIQDTANNYYLLENNVSPGFKTYDTCHANGLEIDPEQRYRAIYGRVLQDMVDNPA